MVWKTNGEALSEMEGGFRKIKEGDQETKPGKIKLWGKQTGRGSTVFDFVCRLIAPKKWQ